MTPSRKFNCLFIDFKSFIIQNNCSENPEYGKSLHSIFETNIDVNANISWKLIKHESIKMRKDLIITHYSIFRFLL